MAQTADRRHILFLQFSISQPSSFNGAEAEDRSGGAGILAIDTTSLRTSEEVVAIVALRMRPMLDTLVEGIRVATEEYNRANPLPEATPAEEEEGDVEYQA